jgi:uncharacterized membrane protein
VRAFRPIARTTTTQGASYAAMPTLRGLAASLVTLVALDLLFLGVVAKRFYDDALGPLRRATVFVPAAVAFYALYVGVVFGWAARGAATPGEAALRGAGVGLVAYGTWDLTNWAVLANWPARLVPVDMAWGIALTAAVAWAGRAAS